MATVRQRSFRIEPELWHQLDLVRDAGHGDTDTAALRWLLARADAILGREGATADAGVVASAELLAAKDAHIASLERALAESQRLADQAQQLAAMTQRRLGEPAAVEPPKRKKKRKSKKK